MRALVLGGAACVWADLTAFHAMGLPVDHVLAVNDAGYAYPHRLDHWVTLHPEHFPVWEPRRSGNADYVRWSNKPHAAVDRVLAAWGAGSSGLLAVTVAVDGLGCAEVWLCGVPMDAQPHVYGGEDWTGYVAHRQAWERAVPRMQGKVFSMSGWTRALLQPEAAMLLAPDQQIA